MKVFELSMNILCSFNELFVKQESLSHFYVDHPYNLYVVVRPYT